MNWLELYVCAWLTKRLIKQGNHRARLHQLFMMLRVQAELEFTESSRPVVRNFLLNCFKKAMLDEEIASLEESKVKP